jgi:ectoine hydroxylase-related dioxygenase (phytanoyl-CoA dioxygenase family)
MRFDERGFQIEPSLVDAHELEPVRAAAAAAPRSRAGSRHLLGVEPIRALALNPKLLGLATACLGAEALPFKATFFDKSPKSNWLVSWHQDLALPVQHRVEAAGWGPWTRKGGQLYALAPAEALARVVALRVHLDDSDGTNGPLRVLPGTHRLGRLTDEGIADAVSRVEAVECLVRAGGVVAMRPLVVHASSKSVSDAPRRVVHLEYAAHVVLDSGVELAVA